MVETKENSIAKEYSLLTLFNENKNDESLNNKDNCTPQICKICIPIIQREYAFGRPEEKEKRELFVKKIINRLSEHKTFKMDFVYGKIDEEGNFYPIDGQQRLTTLYLLHLYLGLFDKNIRQDKDEARLLPSFIYESRDDANSFLQYLIEEDFSNFNGSDLSAFIKNRYWYRNKWNMDPTISSILVMLQEFHSEINNSEHIVNLQNLWTELKNVPPKGITFYFLDLGSEDFNLTDELYIKMNARGKQLTDFENFKANFIDFLSERDSEWKTKYSETFSKRIEQNWCDLFWAYKNKDKDGDIIFDDKLMNYFIGISLVLFYSTKIENQKNTVIPNKSFLIKNISTIYSTKANIEFLFNSLDWLYSICDKNSDNEVQLGKIENFFEVLFDTKNCNIFDNDVNLFTKIINNKISSLTLDLILFYNVMLFVLDKKISGVNDKNFVNLIKYIRIVRNLLFATRQLNEIVYNSNIRIYNLFGYMKLFNQIRDNLESLTTINIDNSKTGISNDALQHEIEKLKIISDNPSLANCIHSLENHYLFQGQLSNLNLEESVDSLIDYEKSINEIWNGKIKDSLISRALVACGFRGLYIRHCNSSAWTCFYFGDSHNWKTILTYKPTDKNTKYQLNIQESIKNLVTLYVADSGTTPEEKLSNIIQSSLSKHENDEWIYYALKYDNYFTTHYKDKTFPHYIANEYSIHWRTKPKNFELCSLSGTSSNPLCAMHINPFVYMVSKIINDKKICKPTRSFSTYATEEPIYIENSSISLFSKEYGWAIPKKGFDELTDEKKNDLKEMFNIQENESYYFFTEDIKLDRVEIAEKFIRELVK